jgi:hypothetical protein
MQYRSVQLILPLIPAIKGFLIISTLLTFWIGLRKSLIDAWRTFSFDDGKNEFQKGTLLTVAVLLTSFILGLGLRFFNLDGFPPYVDEYFHTQAASALIRGEPVAWGRAYLTVSLPVYLSYRVFGTSLWASRLPIILLNMLSIFPLYALGKKINKCVGYIGVILFAFSPWVIAASRTVRDYAVVPLIFYLSGALLVDLLDWDGLSFKQFLLKQKYRLLVVSLILGYTLYDNRSILQTIIAVYGIFGMLAALKVLKQSPLRWLKVSVLCLSGVLVLIMAARMGKISRYLNNGTLVYEVAPRYWLSLVHSEIRQWYFFKELGYVILVIGCLLAFRAVFLRYSKRDFAGLFCFLVFVGYLVYLTFFIASPNITVRARYGVLMEYWYLMVVAIFLYVLFRLVRWVFKKNILVVLVFVLIIAGLFTNYQAVWYVLSYRGGGTFLITGEKHYLVETACDFLATRLTNKDVLLTDFLDKYDEISKQLLHPLETIPFHPSIPNQEMVALSAIDKYPQGWVAVIANPLLWDFGLQATDFVYDGKYVKYYGELGEVYLWQWSETAP